MYVWLKLTKINYILSVDRVKRRNEKLETKNLIFFNESCIINEEKYNREVWIFPLRKDVRSMNLTTLFKIGENLTEQSTFGERMTVGFQVVAIGMGVVFGVLILLIGILQLFKLFSGNKKPAQNKVEEKTVASAPVVSNNVVANDEEQKIVAIATSAIAAARGKSEVDFNVLYFAPVGSAPANASAAPAPEKKEEVAPAAAPAAEPAKASTPVATGDGEKVNAPLPGNILDVKVAVGASVKKGDILCILEAMKMENEIVAPCDGTVNTVVASKGSSVNTGDLLFVIG